MRGTLAKDLERQRRLPTFEASAVRPAEFSQFDDHSGAQASASHSGESTKDPLGCGGVKSSYQDI